MTLDQKIANTTAINSSPIPLWSAIRENEKATNRARKKSDSEGDNGIA